MKKNHPGNGNGNTGGLSVIWVLYVLQGRHKDNYGKGIQGKMLGAGIKVHAFNVTSSFTVDMTE